MAAALLPGQPLLRLIGGLGQEDRLQLRDDVRRDRNQVRRLAGEEVQLVQRQQALQLRDRIGRVVDPDVDEAVVGAEVAAVLPDDEQRGRLHPALVAAAGLARLERRHQPVGEVAPAPLERLREVLHRLVGDDDVALRAVAMADQHLSLARRQCCPCRPAHRPARRPSRRWSFPLKLAALPRASTMPTCRSGSIVSVFMTARSACSAVAPPAMQLEPALAVRGVAQALRRDRADTGARPRHEPAHVGELGLHHHAEVAGDRIPGDEAVGVRQLLEVGGGDDGLLSRKA